MILDDLITTQAIALTAPDTRPTAPRGYRGRRRRPASTGRLVTVALVATGWGTSAVLATAYFGPALAGWFRALPGLLLNAAGI